MPAATSLATFSSSTPAASYATSSYAPTANSLVLAAVLNVNTGGPTVPTFSGNGLTWVQVETQVYQTVARLTLFRALGASPSAGAGTASFGGTSQDVICTILVSEISGVNTGGTNGSAAVAQSDANTGTGTALSAALAAFSDAANATFAVWGAGNNTRTLSPEAGHTEVNELAGVSMTFLNGNDTTPTATQSASDPWAGIAIEIAAAAVGGDPEGSLVGGKLIRGGILQGRLVR